MLLLLLPLMFGQVMGRPDGKAHSSNTTTRALLQADADDCSLETLVDYNLGLHIGSVFILLGVSLLGSLAPMFLRAASGSERIAVAIRLGTYFGFGTILATSLIHMLLPATESLTSACLPAFWTDDYPAWSFLFALVAIMAMQGLDFLIKGWLLRQEARVEANGRVGDREHATCHAGLVKCLMKNTGKGTASEQLAEAGEAGWEHGEPASIGDASTLLLHKPSARQSVAIVMVEAGIIFHSVMIGLTLGVTSGSAFTPLLIALCFHQFFEGFALGSAIVDTGMGAARCTALGLAYSVTTPIGIAIGIGMRESFNQNSASALLTTGILDALSAGILLYVALVQLLSPTMTDSAWLRSQRWPMQVVCFSAFWCGAGTMALIGKWA